MSAPPAARAKRPPRAPRAATKQTDAAPPVAPAALPPAFAAWFAAKGWAPRAHQLALLGHARAGRSALLVAPTGAGKTLAGFLPTLTALADAPRRGEERALHTLYVSPLKALAVDVARNVEAPVREMGLPVRVATRTGDTPAAERARQNRLPPDVLLTTPEQVALMLSHPDAERYFSGLERVVLDELHALAPTKRGDLLGLGLARLRALAPGLAMTGLSATVRDPDELRRHLVAQPPREERPRGALAALVTADAALAAAPVIEVLDTRERLPWAGHTARHAVGEVMAAIRGAGLALVFVNTRLQAELLFRLLWEANDEGLRIALHHGSLAPEQRRRVEAAMASGALDAVVCTSTLDLGVDWGAVDLVVNVGAPKGASRLLQRIGRANHRLDEPSRALLVPTNRFEVLECRAAVDAALAGEQDAGVARTGALDVLAQHVLSRACAGPFLAADLYAEVRSAEPYAGLSRADFDDALSFAATGGYALKAYDRFAKVRQDVPRDGPEGAWRVSDAKVARQHRMNIGTIIAAASLKVRLVRGRRQAAPGTPRAPITGGRVLGEVEEGFAETLTPGDTFAFAGEVLRFEGVEEDAVLATRSPPTADVKVPSFAGSKFPLSTHLAARVRGLLADPAAWPGLPPQVAEWLAVQARRSSLPGRDELLVETFPRAGRHFLVAYPFEGRLAHQTLGMLLTRRLERARMRPLGFVASDYALGVFALHDLSAREAREPGFLGRLFDPDMLGDDLEAWLEESALMKRTFRHCAVIAGLVDRRFPGQEKRARQVTISTDLVYDVLRRYEPGHLLLRAARADAATGLLDVARLSAMLARVRGHLRHRALPRVSPLAVPVILDVGRERVGGDGAEAVLEEAAADLIEEAMG